MGFFIFFLIIFIVLGGGGWLIGRSVGGVMEKMLGGEEKPTYIDKSVHHHYHIHEHGEKKIDQHYHEHKNLTVIDDETYKKIFAFHKNQNNKSPN